MQKSIDNDESRKRKNGAEGQPNEETKKRRSRFADDEGSANVGVAAIAAAAARAAEIAKNLLLKPPATAASNGASAASLDAALKLARATEMQAQLSAQIASVSNLLNKAQQEIPVDRKRTYRALLLDSQGREIDEFGQVVKTQVIKSIAANVAVERELKKKENPYLAHQRVPLRTGTGPPGIPSAALPSSVPGSAIPVEDDGISEQIDDRIVGSNRSIRAKKSLKFVEAGE